MTVENPHTEQQVESRVDTIESFYRTFARRDDEGMAACDHPAVHFSDPAFRDLHGDGARAMWHMLGNQGTDLG